jgi:carboxymethylenebutenolidase
MRQDMIEKVEMYRRGLIDRRELMKSIIAATGGYAAAHLFLESSGLAATLISSQEAQASNVDAETVHYASGDVEVQAYLAKPKGGDAKHPGVIVIHENRGLNEHIRDVTRRFASEGFVAMAPDLLSRAGGTGKMVSPEAAIAAIGQLPPRASVQDLQAGYAFLEKSPDVDPAKISSVGFCWGGWRSFMLATMVPTLHRAVVFYGSTPTEGLQNIQAPVMANYAQLDYRITGGAMATEKEMKELGKKFSYYVYPNANHAFFNDTGDRYSPDAAKLAWTRTLEFLRSSGSAT